MTKTLLDQLPNEMSRKLKEVAQPDWLDPMLATLTHDYFSDPSWIYECKLDGERTLIFKKNKNIRLLSRNKKNQNTTFPEIVETLKNAGGNFILDGEIVAYERGITSFSTLQHRIHVQNPGKDLIKKVPVYVYVFDLLYIDGFLTTNLPLFVRKNILKDALDFKDPIRYLEHRAEKGEAYLKEACKKGWEGLIAKDSHSPYMQKRSLKWLKFKCTHQQEFVIGGFTEPKGSRKGFGALLIGYYKDKRLKYAGRVGTGFDEAFLLDQHNRMKNMEIKDCPFDNFDETFKDISWIKPQLVGEVGFTEWTKDGKLRHPRFLGIRDDKKPQDVKRED